MVEIRLDREQRRQVSERILHDLQGRAAGLPDAAIDQPVENGQGREIPVEQVVDRLIQMTPERLVDRAGPAFVRAVDRYLRLLDLPVIRRFPVIRNLVAYREKSPAEAVALAANYLGYLIQRGLNVVYFFADLHGTLSPPIFLDRLGATMVNAARTPAKRLLWLGSAFLFLFVTVNVLPIFKPLRGVVDKLQTLMGWPVIILGVICLVVWNLGAWFRKIANQSADFCERIVEAQFAAHTKNLKSRQRDQDAQFLAERVIDPELLLRAADDRPVDPSDRAKEDEEGQPRGRELFENRELAFLRNVRLLYQDYLDGSPLHRSDTKASVQLLGNLALGNLRRSHLGHQLREARTLDRLDLSRSGGLLGGAYLWFNYITRLLVQETALLILDYNRHAVPVDRLACSPDSVRLRLSDLAGRPAHGRSGRCLAPRPRDVPSRTLGNGLASSPLVYHRNRAIDPCGCGDRHAARQGHFSRPSSSRRSTFSPTNPSATPKSTRGSARRSPSWFGATASKTSVAPFEASRSTSCLWPPVRSTPTPSTRLIWQGAGLPSCPSRSRRESAGPAALAISSIYRVVHEILHPQGRSPANRSLRHLLGRLAQDSSHA